jgi:AcrR family transcriptional regulator
MEKRATRRPYHSAQRQKQAESTRTAIVAAARRLFFTTGYQATTIEAIAAEAGVSTPTVYAVFGSKRGLLVAISDSMDARAGFVTVEKALAASTDPLEQITLIAAAQVAFFERNADVLEPLREAGRIDEDVAILWTEDHARHRAGYSRLARTWAEWGRLRAGVDEKTAADTMSAIAWIDVYWYFVGRCGWTPDQFRRWLEDAFERLILTPGK